MKSKKIMVVLISLLALGLIGTFIFKLPDVNVTMSRLIHSNPITDTVEDIYWRPPIYLIIIPIAFANVVYAAKVLRSMYKEKTSTHKCIIGYWIYMIISLGALVIHWLTFVYVIKCVLAG